MKKIFTILCILLLHNCRPKEFTPINKEISKPYNNFQTLYSFTNRNEIYFGIYKFKVDSNEYIIVSTYDGIAITKHK